MLPNDRTLLKLAYLERLLASISVTNHDHVACYVRARRAEGLKVSSLINIAIALRHADEAHPGRPLPELTPEEVTTTLLAYTQSHSPASASSWTAILRAFYKHANNGNLPDGLARALRRKYREEWRDVTPISEAERDTLLRVAGDSCQRAASMRRQALIWTLWDSGFRISEALALRIRDFEPDAKGGALLRLPHDAPNLKTGPRTIYVVDCVGPIKTWIAMHPLKHDGDAPIFCSKDNPGSSMWPPNVNVILNDLTKKAGMRHVNPHLFRHTRATRTAVAGWNEPQMRAYFGWSATSTMAARYVHLSQRHMEDRVRQDAQIDAIGARIREDPKAAMAETTATAVRATLEAMGFTSQARRARATQPGSDDDDGAGATPLARS